MTTKEELEELYNLKNFIESNEFQKYFCQVLREKQDKLKKAYDCKTLIELATIKGKNQGIEEFFEILKQIDTDIENKKDEVESQR